MYLLGTMTEIILSLLDAIGDFNSKQFAKMHAYKSWYEYVTIYFQN